MNHAAKMHSVKKILQNIIRGKNILSVPLPKKITPPSKVKWSAPNKRLTDIVPVPDMMIQEPVTVCCNKRL